MQTFSIRTFLPKIFSRNHINVIHHNLQHPRVSKEMNKRIKNNRLKSDWYNPLGLKKLRVSRTKFLLNQLYTIIKSKSGKHLGGNQGTKILYRKIIHFKIKEVTGKKDLPCKVDLLIGDMVLQDFLLAWKQKNTSSAYIKWVIFVFMPKMKRSESTLSGSFKN